MWGVAWCCAILVAACGSDDDDSMQYGQHDDGGGMMSAKCDPVMSPALTTGPSGSSVTDPTTHVTVRVVDADKQPPNKSYNTWQIQVTDASGQPAADARINWACAWMSVHSHGSTPQAINTLGPGLFELYNQNFAMYGPWAVELWVDPTGGGPEYLPQNGALVRQGAECTPTNGAATMPNITLNFCVPETTVEGQ